MSRAWLPSGRRKKNERLLRSPTVIDGFDDIVRSDKYFFPKVECNGGKMLNCLFG